MLLHLSTWAETEAFLARSKTIVIPIGSNEQHGPTGPPRHRLALPGDHRPRGAEDDARHPGRADLQHRHGPAPPGLPRHHRAAPLDLHGGDRRLGALAGAPRLRASCISSTATAATSPPSRRRSPSSTPRRATPGGRAASRCKLRNWWDLRGVGRSPASSSPSGHGSHATPSEIAVTQWAYPDAIKAANYAPQIAPSGPIRESSDFRARHPDGRMGSDPGLATPEKGGELVKLAATGPDRGGGRVRGRAGPVIDRLRATRDHTGEAAAQPCLVLPGSVQPPPRYLASSHARACVGVMAGSAYPIMKPRLPSAQATSM